MTLLVKLLLVWLVSFASRTDASEERLYRLVDSNRKTYLASKPGSLGGHRRLKIYGKLDCANALRWLKKGYYKNQRVFFESETQALNAGYHPCADSTEDRFVLRLAGPDEASSIRRLYNKFRNIFPFIQIPILQDSIAAERLLVILPRNAGDTVLAGAIRWHERRDGWSTVHEILVHPEFQRLGLATALIERVPKPRRLKCLTENQGAMRFYANLGMIPVGTEKTKTNRELTVWEDESN